MRQPSPRVIAYSFNAAILCPSCTAQSLAIGEILEPPSPHRRIGHQPVTHFNPPDAHPFSIPERLVNTNNEPVRAVFSTDDYPDGLTCDECGIFIPQQGLHP